MGIDYFIKWVKAVNLTNVDQYMMIEFMKSHIMCRYGTLETITTHQGLVFVGRKVIKSAVETRIKLLMSTPNYTQDNGQMEAANKVIVDLIKKHIDNNPMSWHTTLNQAF